MRLIILFILFSQIVVAQNQQQFMKTAFKSPYPSGYVHCDTVTVIEDVVNPETGQMWMDRNLGASKVADSLNDEAAYGSLFQWGRFAEGHQCRNSEETSTNATTATPTPGTAWYGKYITEPVDPGDWLSPPDTNLWKGVDGINNPCPSGYRIPTTAEFIAETNTFSSQNDIGAFSSPLKLTSGGYRDRSFGDIYSGLGVYYSSTAKDYFLFTSSSLTVATGLPTALAASIRCIKDITSRYPEGYIHSDTNNITQIKDVLSETGNIWMDRNLGATRVATSSTDSEAYGDLFQWGRFADGHQKRTSDTTSVNATTEVPNLGNTWDGKFILETVSPLDWLTPQDDNLWQGVNGINNPCPSGYRVPTQSEWQAETVDFSPNDRDGAFASFLKFTTSGYRIDNTGEITFTGVTGHSPHWTSTVSGTRSIYTRFAFNVAYFPGYRYYGLGIRCIKDLPSLYAEGTVFCNEPTKIVPVVSLTGKTWMDRNLGASQKATSSTDNLAYGDLYQWGRFADGHQCRDSDTTSTNATTFVNQVGTPWYGKFITEDQSPYNWLTTPEDELWQGEDGVNNPCPDGFRVPTEAELNAERLTFSPSNYVGAYNSPLKFTLSGYRFGNSGLLGNVGSSGQYWTNSVSGTNSRFLTFVGSSASFSSNYRSFGYAIRCIQDYQPLYPKNYVHCTAPTNVVDVVSTTGKVWMDRNLGASQVATSSTDANSYGDLFQWGRAAEGHQCRSSTTTSTQATTVNPLEGNSWDSLFIVTSNNWMSTQQYNLWQGVDGANNPCPDGYRLPTSAEWQAEDDTFIPNDKAGGYASSLKLPYSGYRNTNGSFNSVNLASFYWSSTVSGTDISYLSLSSSSQVITISSSNFGFSVRCIKD